MCELSFDLTRVIILLTRLLIKNLQLPHSEDQALEHKWLDCLPSDYFHICLLKKDKWNGKLEAWRSTIFLHLCGSANYIKLNVKKALFPLLN